MKNSFKKSLTSSIILKISELEQTIESLQKDNKPISPDVSIGRLSRVDAISNQQIRESNLKDTESKLYKLKSNLDHIDSEKFGKCEICGKDIQEKRLQFMPESTRCMNCAN